MHRREFLALAAAGAVSLTGIRAKDAEWRKVGLTPWNGNPEVSARFIVKTPSNLRLLQLTDIHFFTPNPKKGLDARTIDDLWRLVDLSSPDLLLVTGDLWQDNPQGRGEEFMRFGIDKIAALGVPWLFIWGNHDVMDDYRVGHEAFTNAPRSLYRGGPNGGNYLVELVDSEDRPVWDLICMNSHDRGLIKEQHDWLDALAKSRPGTAAAKNAFALFHIPVKQFEDRWLDGSACGARFERVAYEDEAGSSLAHLRALGTVRACFCGHDHINDYSCRAEGMDLVYGRATGHSGYGAARIPKGAKLITVNCETGAYAWESLLADGARWKESPGVHIERYKDAPWAPRPAA